jgi:ECF sigma factor
MNEVTRISNAIDQGETHAAEHLLPLVYDKLPKLAAQKMVPEPV